MVFDGLLWRERVWIGLTELVHLLGDWLHVYAAVTKAQHVESVTLLRSLLGCDWLRLRVATAENVRKLSHGVDRAGWLLFLLWCIYSKHIEQVALARVLRVAHHVALEGVSHLARTKRALARRQRSVDVNAVERVTVLILDESTAHVGRVLLHVRTHPLLGLFLIDREALLDFQLEDAARQHIICLQLF